MKQEPRGSIVNTIAGRLVVVSICLLSGQVTGLSQDSWDRLNQRAQDESLLPVRSGIPGTQPFWNRYAMRFIYAPAFDFKESTEAASYRFTALSLADKETYTFKAPRPWDPLTPVWNKLPVGEVLLKVEGIDAEGRPVFLSGERKFYRAAPFHGPYHSPRSNYARAGERQLEYIFRSDPVQHWLTHKEPDLEYLLNSYPSKMVKATIDAMLAFKRAFSERSPDDCEKARTIATRAADYLIRQSEPPDAPLAYLPPTYSGKALAARNNQGRIMVNVCAGMGQTYLDLYDATQITPYLQSAVQIAETLLRVQLDSGVWPIKVRTDTGGEDTTNFGTPVGIIRFLERIGAYSNNPDFRNATHRAWQWVIDHPMKTFNWEGQFEDVQPSEETYRLMGMHDPCSVASYLLTHRDEDPSYLASALEILRFVEDQFVVWERPLPYGERGEPTSTWFTPSVLEQYSCYTPIDASVSAVASVFYQAYLATDDRLFLEKSRALANSLTQQQDQEGNIPTGWDTVPPTRIRFWWLNCAVGDALFLMNYSGGE